MDASQLLEIVGQQVRPSEEVVVSEITLWESEDLLDWIENQASTNLRAYRGAARWKRSFQAEPKR